MRSIIKYICMFGFLTSCIRDGTILDTTDLTTDFENIWWEPEGSSWLNMLDKRVCLEFITYLIVEEPADGTVLVPEYDVFLKVIVKEDGSYSVKGSQGLFSIQSDIIPCSLGA